MFLYQVKTVLESSAEAQDLDVKLPKTNSLRQMLYFYPGYFVDDSTNPCDVSSVGY